MTASISILSLNNIKILRPEITKNLTNLRKKFCESQPRKFKILSDKMKYLRTVDCTWIRKSGESS